MRDGCAVTSRFLAMINFPTAGVSYTRASDDWSCEYVGYSSPSFYLTLDLESDAAQISNRQKLFWTPRPE